MLGIHQYWLFVAGVVILTLTPGQDTMYILGRSLSGGLRVGVASASGVMAGCMVHTLAATAGLSVLLATSPIAFMAVKLCGAAYLIFLGARLVWVGHAQSQEPKLRTRPAADPLPAFGQGVLTNVLNPKVALFFLAFLPQFISATSSSKTLAFLALGTTVIAIGTVWCVVIAVGAAHLRGLLGQSGPVRVALDRVTGGLFILLGIRLAWTR